MARYREPLIYPPHALCTRLYFAPAPKLKPHQVDFLGETDHFIHALKEGLKSLVGGLELRDLDSATRESSEGLDTRNFTQACVCIERNNTIQVGRTTYNGYGRF